MKYVDILTTAADTKDNIVTFASGDEANPSVWKDVTTLASKEKHSSFLNKISTMFSNVRYLYKILGTTDISALGTVTQAIATLNGNVGSIKGISSSAAITTQGQYALDAREKNASIDGTLANKLSKVNSNLNTKSPIIRRASAHVNVNIDVNDTKTTVITLGDLGIESADTIKSISIHKYGSAIYQLVDYSYDINWSASGSSGEFIYLYTHNGHSSVASQDFEVNVTCIA